MNRTTATLRIVGVLILVVLAWRRAATSDGAQWPAVVGAIVVVAAVVAGVWWSSLHADATRRRVAGGRPGWHTQTVWADATLGAELARLGGAPAKVRGGTRMTLAWSSSQLQLWRRDTVLVSLPWEEVWTITPTVGHAASTGNPAVEVVTRETVRLVVVPSRRPDGGMLPASSAQVDALIDRLREVRRSRTT